ncbi:hypothetical protein QUA42_15790 [Microcoleus sp. Pol11C2]|uniref:hypothetical protein n=1 Tax=Microcoleus sp. Pol11C2 TaxID=3055389 RepID=UPI002FD4FDB7
MRAGIDHEYVNFVSQTESFQGEATARPIDLVEMYKNFRAIGQLTTHRHHWNPVLARTKYHVVAADLLGQFARGGPMFGFRRNFRSQLVTRRYCFAIRGMKGGI